MKENLNLKDVNKNLVEKMQVNEKLIQDLKDQVKQQTVKIDD